MENLKIPAATFAAAAALGTLAACGTAQESANPTTVTVSASPEHSSASAAPAEQQTTQLTTQQAAQLPASVSGYTDEARRELVDEGLTEADVERALAAANSNEAGVSTEWEDDGYFEIEYQDFDIDIRPDGTVIDVDR